MGLHSWCVQQVCCSPYLIFPDCLSPHQHISRAIQVGCQPRCSKQEIAEAVDELPRSCVHGLLTVELHSAALCAPANSAGHVEVAGDNTAPRQDEAVDVGAVLGQVANPAFQQRHVVCLERCWAAHARTGIKHKVLHMFKLHSGNTRRVEVGAWGELT